jgi:surface antigen
VTGGGDAYQWNENAKAQGYSVDTALKDARVGDIIVFETNSKGATSKEKPSAEVYSAGYGHVATVTGITKDNAGNVTSITFSQGEYDPAKAPEADSGSYYSSYTDPTLNVPATRTIPQDDLGTLSTNKKVSFIHPLPNAPTVEVKGSGNLDSANDNYQLKFNP